MLKTLFNQSALLEKIHLTLESGDDLIFEELWNTPKAILSTIAQVATGKNILIVTGEHKEESSLFHDFPLLSERKLFDFPSWETLPGDEMAPSPDTVGERYQVLKEILAHKEPAIILTGLQACLQKLIQPETFERLSFELKKGQKVGFEILQEKLEEMQYEKTPVASDKGQYAVRGGIIDFFPVSSPDPFRIEFWGDEIESIRIYDPIGQKSIQKVKSCSATPATEMELIAKENELSTLAEYLGPDTLIIFDDLVALEDRYASLISLASSSTHSFSTLEDMLETFEPMQKIFFSKEPLESISEVKRLGESGLSFSLFNRSYQGKRLASPFLTVTETLEPGEEEPLSGDEIIRSLSTLEEHTVIHFITKNEHEEQTLQKKLLDFNISFSNDPHYHMGYLSSGFSLADTNFLFIPFSEISRRMQIRRQKLRSTYHTPPTEAFELKEGDMVVHLNHGIGQFLGIERKKDHNGIDSEFFHLQYAGNSKLFVPIHQAHLLTKYIGSTEQVPKMHTIGGGRWKLARDRTQQAIMGYAADLLDLYAKREMSTRAPYPEDSADLQAFEEDFPFIETEDQLAAISKIKTQMQEQKPIDLLVCGDVGYGKTEVAIRAAFKAVVDGGKQVAVLVPTTVLAMQHFENFCERMAHFPINVGVLSRFQNAKQTRETLQGIQNGSVDILIGTHRIISKDVHFKDMGLVIIDEEQRFGVKVKEKLKQLKVGADCLTLSATPIPRTLYMSLIGARDLATINTPPQDRLPIKTILHEPNEKLIRTALQRELARDGQAFFIHNRVETIFEKASYLKKLLPDAKIAVAHGQMHADEIDDVFHAFKSGVVDILVATSIVENGIDIPNANTIIVDRADMFGVADLYQLRGRVGRWNRRAYCYFLVPKLHRLPEITRLRLDALCQTSGYGGGMKVALRDLELRGAGDILGTEQSGHVSAIGFHLYCKLLKRTVKTLQGSLSPSLSECKIEVDIDARLPEDFVNEPSLRMEFYQRLGEAYAPEEVEEIKNELIDRFGPLPMSARFLIQLSLVRVYAQTHGFTVIKSKGLFLTTEKLVKKKTDIRKGMIKPGKTPEDWGESILNRLREI